MYKLTLRICNPASLKSTQTRQYIQEEVELIQTLFEYLTTADKGVYDKVGSVAFIPFDVRYAIRREVLFVINV